MRPYLSVIEEQINRLLVLSNQDPFILEYTGLCKFITNLTTESFDNYSAVVTHIIRNTFERNFNDLKKEEILSYLDKYFPFPAPKINPTKVDSSLITSLNNKTSLNFFGMMDDKYHVNAYVNITHEDERAIAKKIQTSSGLGKFNNTGGITFFVIENINNQPIGDKIQALPTIKKLGSS